jgi:uncharacterized protein YPO0396
MTPAELPFLAELIDVKPDQARWRSAVETVLGGSARLMLVPKDQFARSSAAIDPLHLRGRLTFHGVAMNLDSTPEPSTQRLAGKVDHKDTPFRGWVQNHLAAEERNLLCVEDARDLDGPGGRVTLAGQTRRGMRGSHGRSDTVNIIGFSNEDALADIEVQLSLIENQLSDLDQQRNSIDEQRASLGRRRRGFEAVQDVSWTDIDVAGSESRIRELEHARELILSADDRLQALEGHIAHLDKTLDDVQERHYKYRDIRNRLNAEHTSIVDRQDEVTTDLDQLDRDGVTLSDTQTAHLDAEFAAAVAPRDPAVWADFVENCARLQGRLNAALTSARLTADRAAEALTTTFQAYQNIWEDPNLGVSVDSYPDYADILDNILSTGLHHRRAEWRLRLTTWSGEDLVPLAGAMETCIEDIEERLIPVNEILRHLPFGANKDRLQIKLRRLTPETVVQFRKDLRTLSSAATKNLTDEQLEARFRALQRFMARIRRRDDPRALPDVSERDRLLDVRWHVEVTAQRFSPAGDLLSTHSSLGGKSGGESQELVAFIVGAALRFRLGDEEVRARPRFAPVFLDEGFIKSDAEFAGRAVQAWKHLGFQLIVGAPLDKVTALEPHMDEMLAITKNTATHFSYISRLADSRDDENASEPASAQLA